MLFSWDVLSPFQEIQEVQEIWSFHFYSTSVTSTVFHMCVVNVQVPDMGHILTGVCLSQRTEKANHESTSSFHIPSFQTFLLTALNPPSEKHKVLNLLAPFLMDCFSLPFWDYAKVPPPRAPLHWEGGQLVYPWMYAFACVCVCTYTCPNYIEKHRSISLFCSLLCVLHRRVTDPDVPLHYPFLWVCVYVSPPILFLAI